MNINHIRIQGYKSVRDVSLALKKVNVLIGGNGIGKTNFISTFELIKNICQKQLQTKIMKLGGSQAVLYMGPKRTSEIEFELNVSDDSTNGHIAVSLVPGQQNMVIKHFVVEKYRDEELVCGFQSDGSFEVDQSNAFPKEYYNYIVTGFDVYHFHDTGDSSAMKGLKPINDNQKLKSDGSNIAPYLYYLQERHPKYFNRIESIVSSVCPSFGRFSLKPNRLNEQMIQLEWSHKEDSSLYLNEFQMSDGTLRFICLATLLLQPNPNDVIIIDEPELGLHPQAINKLSALIKYASEHSQIIISTQSVSLVDNFEPEDIVVANYVDGATSINRLDPAQLVEWINEYSLGEIWEMNIIGGQPI